MSRRLPCLAAVSLLLLSLVSLVSCGEQELRPVPTTEVRAEPFVHRITAEGILEATTVTPVTVSPEIRTSVRLAWVAPEASRVEEGDVVARFDSGSLEQTLQTGRSSHRSAEYRITRTRSTGEAEEAGLLTELEVAELEIELASRFEKKDEGVWSRHEILSSRIDEELARDRRRHASEKRETQSRRIRSDLDLLEIDQHQAGLKIEEAETGLAALEVRAPHDGIFLRARDWTGEPIEVGQQLWRGREIGEIPDLSKMQAKVWVLEADAGGIAAGQSAEVIVESRPGEVHRGEVSRVDAVAQPRQRGSPVQYFGVTVELDRTLPEMMKPGQRVRATIYVAREDDALVVPRQAVERRDEGDRVFVQAGDRFEPRTVSLGPGTRSRVVVVEGLSPGERIALARPEMGEEIGGGTGEDEQSGGSGLVTGVSSDRGTGGAS